MLHLSKILLYGAMSVAISRNAVAVNEINPFTGIQQKTFDTFGIPFSESEKYLLIKPDLNYWQINSMIKRNISPEAVKEICTRIPNFSGYDIADMKDGDVSLEYALEVKSVFPEASGSHMSLLKETLERKNLTLAYARKMKSAIPDLTAYDAYILIKHNFSLAHHLPIYKKLRTINKYFSCDEIIRFITIGLNPEDAKRANTLKSWASEGFFSWVTILALDPNIKVTDDYPTDVRYIDFIDKNKAEFKSNTKTQLPVSREIYTAVGNYVECPDYTQKEFDDLINKKLAKLNITPQDVAKMDPYDAIMLAVTITTDSLQYFDVDSIEYKKQHGHSTLIELLKAGIGDCDRYTRTFISIAYYFKKLNPNLINFHFIEGAEIGGRKIGHTWPGIIIACNDKEGNLTLKYTQIDPTFYDNGNKLPAKKGYHFTLAKIKSDLGIE